MTELVGVGQTINMTLYMFFHVNTLAATATTSLAVKYPVYLLHQLLYFLLHLCHVSE